MSKRLAPVLLLLAFLFSACQPATPSAGLPDSTPEVAATKIPAPTQTSMPVSRLEVQESALRGLTVEVWHPWHDAEASLFESQVKNFNDTNPWGITVQTKGLQNYTELFDTVTPTVHGPGRPDVVVGLPEHALIWDTNEAVLDLTPYVSDPVYGLSAMDVADFPTVFWEQDQVGGKRYGVPAQRTARFLLYNTTWAQELGYSSSPTTADEFRQQACAANQAKRGDADTKNDAAGGWLIDIHPMTALSWMLSFGGGGVEGNGFRFLTPENIDAMRFVKGLSESGCAWQTQDADPLSNFVDRSALFATASLDALPGLAREFAAAGSRDEWTVLPFPGQVGTSLVVYGSSYILFESDDARQLAAWLFVRSMLAADVQAKWVQTTGLFPLRASTMNLLTDYAADHPQWAEATKLIPQGQMTPQLAAWKTVRVMLGDGFNHMFRVDVPVGQVPAVLAQMDAIVTDLGQ